MNCCLWLNSKKVRNADEIISNFDLASLRGYFLGGSLIKWLNANGGTIYAEKLNQISAVDNINEGICYAFGMNSKPNIVKHETKEIISVTKPISSSFNSQIPNLFTSGSYLYTRLMSIGSGGLWNYASSGGLWNYASSGGLWNYASSGGLWNYASSGGLWNYAGSGGLWNYVGSGSYSFLFGFGSNGSGVGSFTEEDINRTEQLMILCPLNRYGYGIHLI